jgi:diacylglycerol kinase family enzyme
MRARLIVNPTASGVSDDLIESVAAVLGKACDVELAATARQGHAVELAAAEGAEVVVAMGGDGTANEVCNGVGDSTWVGFLPAGASSVFARHLGYPNSPLHAAEMVAEAIRSGSVRAVGLGELAGRRFTFAAGIGLDAEVMRLVDEEREHDPRRRRPGDLRVVAAAVRALRADGLSLPVRMRVEVAGRRLPASFVAVVNQHPYTYFGPLPVRAAPLASFDTALDAVVVGELRTRDLWRLGLYTLVWPRHATHHDDRVGYLHDVSELSVTCVEPLAVQLDGEYLGRFSEVAVRYLPGAITALVPVERRV